MKFQVRLTLKAEQDAAAVMDWFRQQQEVEAGSRWFGQLMAANDTLETMPQRCPIAAEAPEAGVEIRELLVGRRRSRYRVIFLIDKPAVHILRIWHSARDAISREDL